MADVSYSIYCVYTTDNKIYIGLSKNPQLRLHQHWYKSSNKRLRALVDDPSVQLFSRILRNNLTLKEANELEKAYIKRYRDDPKYTVLNILSGGRAINANERKVEKISKQKKLATAKLSDNEIVEMRIKYSLFQRKFKTGDECKKYGLSREYFRKVLKGEERKNLSGPLLGKDYVNG